MSSIKFDKARKSFEELRDKLISSIEEIDSQQFIVTEWNHKDDGGGWGIWNWGKDKLGFKDGGIISLRR